MSTLDFDHRSLMALKPTLAITDYWDTSVPGPGLFGLRVMPSGVKSWNILYRVGGVGPLKRWTFGRFPAKGLADARDAGKKGLRDAANGIDPSGKKREKRERARETVSALFEKYIKSVEARRKAKAGDFRSWPDVRRSFERDVIPEWGTRPVRDIKRKDVKELVTAKALAGPVAANRLQAHISMLFSFAVDLEWMDANPAIGLKKRDEQPRDRVLTPAEIVALRAFLDGPEPLTLARGKKQTITMPTGAAATVREVFKMLLLCGQRLGETANMKWADVDLDAGTWTIPATDAKNGVAHRVGLSRQAKAILAARHAAMKPGARFVFPAEGPRTGSVMVWAKRAAPAIGSAINVTFTAHDIRRTFATGLGELGIDDAIISLCLNHKKQGVTGRHYDLSKRETAKREAWQAWADHVDTLVTGQQAKVVQMRRRRA